MPFMMESAQKHGSINSARSVSQRSSTKSVSRCKSKTSRTYPMEKLMKEGLILPVNPNHHMARV